MLLTLFFRYWIYAAVKNKCLIVTNDEMRDHIFELLGQNCFLKWKERHQVCITSMQLLLKFHLVVPSASKSLILTSFSLYFLYFHMVWSNESTELHIP